MSQPSSITVQGFSIDSVSTIHEQTTIIRHAEHAYSHTRKLNTNSDSSSQREFTDSQFPWSLSGYLLSRHSECVALDFQSWFRAAGGGAFDGGFLTQEAKLDFVLISVHLQPGDGLGNRVRRAQDLGVISAWIDSHDQAEHDIIPGDMNIENAADFAAVTPPGFISLNDECQPTNTKSTHRSRTTTSWSTQPGPTKSTRRTTCRSSTWRKNCETTCTPATAQ